MTFVALDFETANAKRSSVCAVGMARVVDGRVVEVIHQYVRPPGGQQQFTNTRIHGITKTDVSDAPEWPAIRASLVAAIAGSVIIAYSDFDSSAWDACDREYAMPGKDVRFLDLLKVAKSSLTLDDYKLPTVARHFGIDASNHHRADADALLAAQIALAFASAAGVDQIDRLWAGFDGPHARAARARPARSVLPQTDQAADARHWLFGQTVCFSGELDAFTRPEAQQLVADHGAFVSVGVTKKTTLVVVGTFDPATLRAGTELSKKVEKARTLKAEGQDITIVDEGEFLRLMETG